MSSLTRIDGVNILLVDDQPAKLLTYQTILADLGETLLTATSATEALECLLKNEVAVVLVDVCMPDFDGYELAAMIRQHPRFHRTSIIFVSAVMHTDLDRLRGYEAGAVDFMPVPVVPAILKAKVSVFADLYRKTRALARLNAELEQRVTERTAALEASTTALQEADRRKDEFLAMLAHELRNPLAPIRTAAQLLRLKELPEAQRVRAREVIERQVEHLVYLIDDLLDVSRITRGMITLQCEPVLIGAIVARAVETARPALDGRRHELTVELPEELLTVDGDKTRLVQLLGNLLHNAGKFTEPGGRIALRVTRDGGMAAISVRDNGIGIRANQLAKVFDLFTQLHGQAQSHQGGLGIGLALVRRLAEMHGGSVVALSDGLGTGTEFVVRLPLLASPGLPAHAYALAADSGLPAIGARRILVVDDNHDAADTLALQLTCAGHDVRVAHDGLEALQHGEAFCPHVVLLDLGMPRLDGYATAAEMRSRPWGRAVRIVAVTGWGQAHDREQTARAGFDAHLVKPLTEVDLLRALSGHASDASGEAMH